MTPLPFQAELSPDGTWWIRHGVDLSHIFEGWPSGGQQVIGRQLVMELM